MTREEFFRRQAEARIQIQRLCFPWGWFYTADAAIFLVIAFLLACLFLSLRVGAGFALDLLFSGGVIGCLLLIIVSNRLYKRNVRHYLQWNVACPACHRSLVFMHRWETEEIEQNHCPHCQDAIFDEPSVI